MVLSAWVDSAWFYRAWVDDKCVIGVGGQCMVLSAWVDSACAVMLRQSIN